MKNMKTVFIKKRYNNLVVDKSYGVFEVDNWIVSDFILNKIIPIVGIRPFPLNELMLIVSSVIFTKPTNIYEWGTNIGKSARIFYEICQSFNIASEIDSIDLPDDIHHQEHPHSDRGILVKKIKEVRLHQGDGLDVALSLHEKIGKNGKLLFFLDGDHSYKSVKRELNSIINRFPESNILIHDTFYQTEEAGYNIGPYNAIIDVLSEIPNTFKKIEQNIGLPGITFLYSNEKFNK